MKYCAAPIWFLFLFPTFSALLAQEAGAGIDLRTTVTGEAVYANQLTESPRSGAPAVAGFRSPEGTAGCLARYGLLGRWA